MGWKVKSEYCCQCLTMYMRNGSITIPNLKKKKKMPQDVRTCGMGIITPSRPSRTVTVSTRVTPSLAPANSTHRGHFHYENLYICQNRPLENHLTQEALECDIPFVRKIFSGSQAMPSRFYVCEGREINKLGLI